jgi:membrane-associated phospholipid phosphatase
MDGVHRDEARAVLLRALAPGVAVLAVLVGIGWLIMPPGIAIPTGEESISKTLEASRTDGWNAITLVWSLLGSHGGIIVIGLLVAGLIYRHTRNWRLAAIPVLATSLQEVIFLIAANIIDRPRPDVAQLDNAPPTASYPSGHVGAATALYLTFALLALNIRITWLRWLTVVVCLAVPPLVAFGRLYRGMHYLTDVGAAFLNGIVCTVLAFWCYRTVTRSRATHPGEVMTAARPDDKVS